MINIVKSTRDLCRIEKKKILKTMGKSECERVIFIREITFWGDIPEIFVVVYEGTGRENEIKK